jgi:hypothetical protein
MEHDDVAKLPMAHADQLNSTLSDEAAGLMAAGAKREDLLPLLHLTERLKRALTPVSPPESYRRKLEHDLFEMARLRARGEVVISQHSPYKGLIIGTAVALMGGIAYWVHSRNRPERELPAGHEHSAVY